MLRRLISRSQTLMFAGLWWTPVFQPPSMTVPFSGSSIIESRPREINDPALVHGLNARNVTPDGRVTISTKTTKSSGQNFMQFNFSTVQVAAVETTIINERKFPYFKVGTNKALTLSDGTTPFQIKYPSDDPDPPSSHIAIGFDPLGAGKKGRSHRCNLNSSSSNNSIYECYEIIVYTTTSVSKQLSRMSVKLVVEAFEPNGSIYFPKRILHPQVVKATISDEGLVKQYYKMNGQKYNVPGWEISTTADSRLLAFNAEKAKFIYNFSPNYAHDGWSLPMNPAELPNVKATLNGRSFQEHYPIARQFIRTNKGFYCNSKDEFANNCHRMAYPWISQDGADLFFDQVTTSNGEGGTTPKAAFSVVGVHTGYKVITLDHNFNSCRLNPVGEVNGPGLLNGMWSTWNEAYETGIFPFKKRPLIQPLFSIPGKQYGEFDLAPFNDLNYVVHFPMNELIETNNERDALKLPGEVNFTQARNINHFQTPDISNGFHTAQLLGGAQFPQEFRMGSNGDGQYCSVTTHDNIGLRGRAIYFTQPSSLLLVSSAKNDHVNPNANLVRLNADLKNFTFEVGLNLKYPKLGNSTNPIQLPLLKKGNAYGISLLLNGTRTLSVDLQLNSKGKISSQNITFSNSSPIETDKWVHIAIRGKYNPANNITTVEALINGELLEDVKKLKGYLSQNGAGSDLIIGPDLNQLANSNQYPYVYILDEVAISDIARDNDFLKVSSGLDLDRSNKFFVPTSMSQIPKPLSSKLGNSKWAYIKYFRIPQQMAKYFNPNNSQFSKFSSLSNLGQSIFTDKNLAGTGVACSSCHHLGMAFTDGKAVSTGVHKLDLNAPTIMNRIMGTRQFFDGRRASLYDMVTDPIVNPNEMGGTLPGVLAYLNSSSTYLEKLRAIYGENATFEGKHLRETLTAYLLIQISPDTTFDQIVAGTSLIAESERVSIMKGYNLFSGKARCINCHSGSNFSDELRHQNGIPSSDGRQFKTPTLRVNQSTDPFFHNGSVASMLEVLGHYDTGNRSFGFTIETLDPELRELNLTTEEKTDLVNFLNSLGSK